VIPRLQADGHERQVRAVVHRALAHECHGDRDVEALREGPKRRRGAAPQDAVAGEHDRPLRGRDQARGVLDGLVGRLRKVGAAGLQRPGPVARIEHSRRDVLGDFDVGRPRLREGGDPEGLPDDLGDRRDVLEAGVPLRDRPEHLDDVDDLVGLLVELVGRGLPRDRDHRRTVQVRVSDARQEVRGARAQRRQRHRRATSEPAVDVGHERGALLVTGRDMADGARPR